MKIHLTGSSTSVADTIAHYATIQAHTEALLKVLRKLPHRRDFATDDHHREAQDLHLSLIKNVETGVEPILNGLYMGIVDRQKQGKD